MAFSYGNRLLLDMDDGASLAYSLRKLSRNYNGPVLTIRRDSDNAELDIGFYRYTLDTQAISDFVGAGSGYVKVWYDQSGFGNNLQQTSSLAQPLIYSSGSLILQGVQPTIYLTSSMFMTTSNIYQIPQPLSIFRVNRHPVTDGKLGAIMAFLIPGAGTSPLYLSTVSTGTPRMNAGINASYGTAITHQVGYNLFNSSNSRGVINNTSDNITNPGGNTASGSFNINDNLSKKEYNIQEIVIYPSEKPNYRSIMNYINNFYQVY